MHARPEGPVIRLAPRFGAMLALVSLLCSPLVATASTVRYERVLPLSGIERFSGAGDAAAIDLATWRQLADELQRATETPFTPGAAEIARLERAAQVRAAIPLAVIDARYERSEPAAANATSAAPAPAPVTRRAFAFSPLVDRTYRADVSFRLDPALWFSNDAPLPQQLTFDAGDGLGARTITPDALVRVRYAATGAKRLELRYQTAAGDTRIARATFTVEALASPTPDDTLHITASIPYQGIAATADAYVRLAPGHTQLTNPVVLVEGFDLDNSMNWDELYTLMNKQGLADSLAADGFDAVVLNFTDSTEPIQRNAFVVAELIQQVQAAIDPSATLGMIGASMGGLCSRYALAYMEANALPHRVRTWIAFDSPHGGAVIPLGIQYWVDFFAGQSADAALLRDQLNRPAARQMLLSHYTTPATSTAAPDPLRATMLADFAAVGDYPALPRTVAVVNGSGAQQSQGFLPGDQLVRYEYSDFLFAATGNVWALRDQTSQMIFDGRIRILFSTTTRQVTVSGSPAWDGAPGGWRSSMAQMDSVTAPFGDIIALHGNHCFIPTVSALALSTTNPFYDVLGDPDLVSHTPFDALYVPVGNQPHVEVTAENALWFRAELAQSAVGVAPRVAPGLALRAAPNPFRDAVRIELAMSGAGPATLEVFGLDGRRVRTLLAGNGVAGARAILWDGRDSDAREVPPGIYFVRLAADGVAVTRRVVRLR